MKFAGIFLALVLGAACDDGGEATTPPPFQPPTKPEGDVYFAESFSNKGDVWGVWVKSEAKKDGGEDKYDGEREAGF